MIAPRLEINLDKIYHNAKTLVDLLSAEGISVTGVTKACLGSPEIANTMVHAGVSGLGDSRLENIKVLRKSGVDSPLMLIRSPMMSQACEVVKFADISFNTELDVIHLLSLEAVKANREHKVVLMVETGDLREGLMPKDMLSTVEKVLGFPNIEIVGIGTNLACRCGVVPDAQNMCELSLLANSIETKYGLDLQIVSGGNSSNLAWALSDSGVGRVNNLRIGEAILLGCDPLTREPVKGLSTDGFRLIAEVIELKHKPSLPWGRMGQTAYGIKETPVDQGQILQAILAVGCQDIDPLGLEAPGRITILGASSDHLIVNAGSSNISVGSEVEFQLNYSALVRAMTSPFISKWYFSES